jgi:2-polyprenyl-3-methyl-5-hydroxy-6-metoxy-1,4-benzoquinol methylase
MNAASVVEACTCRSAGAACPVCGGLQVVRLGKWAGDYDRLRCAECSLVFADPLEGSANIYDQQYEVSGAYALYLEVAEKVKSGKKAFGWPYRILLRRLTTLRFKGTFFEVGCGAGYFLYYMKKRSWKALGCDVDPSAVKAGKEMLNVEVIHSNFHASIVEDHSLDVLAAFEVIEHLEDPIGFLHLASKKLRKGGYLFLSTPNAGTKWPQHWSKERTVLPPFHLTVFSERSMQRAAESAGFEVVEFKQKPVPFRYEFMDEGYAGSRLLLEALKAFLTGVKGVTLFTALRNSTPPSPGMQAGQKATPTETAAAAKP